MKSISLKPSQPTVESNNHSCHSTKNQRSIAWNALAQTIAYRILTGRAVTTAWLRESVSEATGGTDAEGAWMWKDAYDAVEAALVWLVKERGEFLFASHGLQVAERLQELCPTQTRRTAESIAMQQFSTPLPLACVASVAAGLRSGDVVLEPSAGTGLLAAWSFMHGTTLVLNELSPHRREILGALFPNVLLFDANAEQIDDLLPLPLRPSVVLMNPPFSASPNLEKRSEFSTLKHISSALARLQPGGRLVCITAHWFSPLNPDSRDFFVNMQQTSRIVFSAGVEGRAFRKHGTKMKTRLTVIDKIPAENPQRFRECDAAPLEVGMLLQAVFDRVPSREQLVGLPEATTVRQQQPNAPQFPKPKSAKTAPPVTYLPQSQFGEIVEIAYDTVEWQGSDRELGESVYEPYELQTLVIHGAARHPTPLVQSAAMAAVSPPKPTYRPLLPKRVIEEGLLSDIQLECVIYTGQVHETYLTGWYRVDNRYDSIERTNEGESDAVRFRRGFFNSDGTGVGKGRQVAGVLLDNWLRDRKKALWISKSDKLLEDARRDWTALGGVKEQIVPLHTYALGESISLQEGIIFTTYATLRTEGKQGKRSRVEQLVDWLGSDFSGAIVFDESHAMANATPTKGERGNKRPSLQGIAGLRLQRAVPDARVLYVSATGATTVQNLGYLDRLGLWNSSDSPFGCREKFLSEMENAGVAGLEVLARDLKALGLYLSRTLSFEGVEYQILEHELTPQQIEIYDTYAQAFKIVHHNLEEALTATNIVSPSSGARNSQARAAARSTFESHKLRFFNFLLTGMKCLTLLPAIERDIAAGFATVIQLVTTNEAMLERRLANIPASQWDDLHVDITPREYIMDYLIHVFPVQLFEVYADDEGNEKARPMFDADGNPVICQAALKARTELVEQIAMLPPVPSALDQILQTFGALDVAEITGRSIRIVREVGEGRERLVVQKRSSSHLIAETHAFMNDSKRILVFSGAGAVGRSYHADLNALNRRKRIHYLLEAGWRADEAIQGLGRTHRSNQVEPPLFRPVTTNVKGEKRFISTIARRLDSLGAISKGQRQTGSAGIFRAEDNLESYYAKAALRDLFWAIYQGKVECCSIEDFEEDTRLSLSTESGTYREELPPMSQFLNRLLALPINKQNALSQELELRIASEIEEAIASGTYEVGVETLKGQGFRILDAQTIYTHYNGSNTLAVKLERKLSVKISSASEAVEMARQQQGRLVCNERSGAVAIAVPTTSRVDSSGAIVKRIDLIRPSSNQKFDARDFARSRWRSLSEEEFVPMWQAKVDEIPKVRTEILYLIAGLLLPIWNCLDARHMKVYRLRTDCGKDLLGRVAYPETIEGILATLGVRAPRLSAAESVEAALNRNEAVPLARGWKLRSVKIMGAARLEIAGEMDKQDILWLRSLGCFTEVIDWKMRVFVSLGDKGLRILEKISDRG